MRIMHCGIAAGALALSLAGAVGVAGAAEAENVIKYRQSVMKAVGGHTGAIAAIAKGEAGDKAHLASHATALAGLGAMAMAAFAEKTEGGKTRAKPEIWSDADGFKKVAMEFQAAADELAAGVAGGGEAGPHLKRLFDSCKGCHKDYREKAE